jgi:O-methyltransferase involved in polyketide biosynthesis
VLVISEGLLVYLTPAQVTSLAVALHARPAFQAWIANYSARFVVEGMRRGWGRKLKAGNAGLHFAPDDVPGFFLERGWREREHYSFIEEGRRLGRHLPISPILYPLLRFGPRRVREQIRRALNIALMERV